MKQVETKQVHGRTYYSLDRSGLCTTAAEAMERAVQIAERRLHTEAPEGCPSMTDLAAALVMLRLYTLRDGGESERKVLAAIAAGPGTAEAWRALDAVRWAIGMVQSDRSPMVTWPSGGKRLVWPHEI